MAQDRFKFAFNGVAGHVDVVQDVALLVEGPASATDNAITVYDSTTGKLLKNSSAVVQTDGRVTAGADGSGSLDLITKQQLDAAIQGVDVKEGVRAASTIDLTLANEQTVDTVALVAGNRVLVKNQATTSENGVYIVVAGGPWTRATDCNSAAELNGALVTVNEGTAGRVNTGWYQSAEIVTLDTDPVTFVQFFGAGTYAADGNGIELSGSTFALELDGTTLSKSASGLKVAALGITNSEVATAAAIGLAKLAALTANRAVASDSSGILVPSATTDTELGYVNGVTSAIQTQLNGKEASFVTLPVSKGGTNSGTALNNNRIIISNTGAIVENTAITASRALASDSNGIPIAATTTAAELEFVNGVTSAIQTQLNGKQASGSYALDTLANLSTTAINADLIFDKATPIIKSKNTTAAASATVLVTSGDTSTASFVSGNMNIETGDVAAAGTVSSGSINVTTGTSTYNSGSVSITTGTSPVQSSGSVTINTGPTTTNAVATGNVLINTGAKTGTDTGSSGQIQVITGSISGTSTSTTGATTLGTGTSALGASGVVTIASGTSGATTSAASGVVTIESGAKSGTASTGVSGNIVIKSGARTATGIGLTGAVQITTGNNSTSGSTGAISATSGTPATGFNSGAITFASGPGSNASGAASLKSGDTAGSSAAATTGIVTIASGANSNSSTGASGAVNINSGDKTTGTAASGAITVQTGTSTATSGVASIVTGAGVAGTGAANITTGNASAGNSGNIVLTTGTASGTRGSVSVNALDLNMNSTKIINVTDPTAAQDAATMAYVDSKTLAILSVATSTACAANKTYLVDCSAASRTMTLPTPALNRFVTIKDSTGSSETNSIIVARNASESIEGVAGNFTMSSNFVVYTFASDGTNWFII